MTQTNEVLTQNYVRAFTQRGGPGPNVPVRYAGAEEQHVQVGDISNPDRGGVSAINVNDPRRRGAFRRVGVTMEAPDIPSASLLFKQRFGGVPWYTFRLDCPFNLYESEGLCEDPSDFGNGWKTMKILSQGVSTDKSYSGRTPFDGSDESLTEINFSWLGGVYSIGGILLGETAAEEVSTEVVDIVYGSYQNCANCGVPNDGTKWIYALQQTAGGSSSDLGRVVYSIDHGATWQTSTITGLGNGSLVNAINIVGQYLVVLSSSDNAYFISSINKNTGVPGAWTKVSTGFVATKNPVDMFVESPNRIYFVGLGGYIYVSTNIAAGVNVVNAGAVTTNNLNRITGRDNVLLAVGANNTIVKSTNRGASWIALSGVTGNITAVGVRSAFSLWVGTAAGALYYSEDQGDTWINLAGLPGVAPTAVHDIVWPSAECGFVATSENNTAHVFATFDGGYSWYTTGSARLPDAPTYGRPNRLAFPDSPDVQVSANNLAVAGLGGGLTDGIILVGSALVL